MCPMYSSFSLFFLDQGPDTVGLVEGAETIDNNEITDGRNNLNEQVKQSHKTESNF